LALVAMKQSQLIAKNVLAGALSIAVGGVLQLAIVVIVARRVSVADFGIFSFITVFAFVVQRVADGGLSTILMRDLAIKPERISEVLGAMLSMAWGIVGVALLISGAALALAQPLGLDRGLVGLIVAMGLGGLGDFVGGCWGAVLRAREDQEIQAAGFALHKVVTLALIFPALALGLGLPGIVAAHLVGTLVQWWLYRWVVRRRYARPRLKLDVGLWKYLLRESIPVGTAAIARLLGDQADLVILAALAGSESVGLFSGPYRMAAGLRFLPQAMMIALVPLYARAATEPDKHAFQEAYERGVRAFLLMAFPAATLFLLCPGTLTVGLLGEQYRAAVPAMRLLSVGVWLIFVGTPFPYLLTALNRQRFLLLSAIGALVLRVGLDYVLTRRYGFLAPCGGLIVSESLLVTVWAGYLWLEGFTVPIVAILWRPIVGSLVAGMLLYVVRPASLLSLAALSALCGTIYLGAVLKLGAVSNVELELVREGMEFLQPLLGRPREARRKAS